MTSASAADRPVVAADLTALLEGATDRVVVRTGDAKSGSTFERLVMDGERRFFKSLSYDEDWIMRVTGDVDHRQFKVWKAGLYHRFPATIDHAIIAMAVEGEGTAQRLGILMRDIGEWLIPEGDDVVSEETHRGLIADMAALHAGLWGYQDTIGLAPLEHRFRFFAPEVIAPELLRTDVSPVITVAELGWAQLAERTPELFRLARAIHMDPSGLAGALRSTPSTFLPGDWKMGNLGRHADGRTILLDCAYPGEGPGGWDLGWYLAMNRARLPISKEETIEWYGESLERHGISTDGWFERQIQLSLLAIITCFGWEKALGDDDELHWWEDQAFRAAPLLDA